MSSSSPTWTTDTNTKSGTVQIYSSNVSVLRVVADEGGSAILDLFADQGDDNADKWRMWVNASDDDLHFSNYTSGSAWTDILTLQDGGNVGIGTATPATSSTIGVEIQNTTTDAAAEGGALRLTSNHGAQADTNRLGVLEFAAYDGSAFAIGGKIDCIASETWDTSNNAAALNFYTTANNDDPTVRMTITHDGRVGIGFTPTANMAGLSIESGLLTLKERATPTADTNYGKIYTKSDNKLYFQDGAGTEHEISFA